MAATTRRRNATTERNGQQSVGVTLLYDDLSTALRAQALFDCVAAERPMPAKIDFEFWRFDFLRDVAMRAKAVRTARRSAIVIVSTRNQDALPPHLGSCVNEWLAQPQQRSCTFAVLFADGAAPSRQSQDILMQWRRAAKLSDVDFFCEMPAGSLNECFAETGAGEKLISGAKGAELAAFRKMQYASGSLASSHSAMAPNDEIWRNNRNFTGVDGLSVIGTITANEICRCQKSKQFRLKAATQRMAGGTTPTSAWPVN